MKYDVSPLIKASTSSFAICPERVWPSVEQAFTKAEILIIDQPHGIKGAFHWRASDNQVTNTPLDQLDTDWVAVFHMDYY